MNLQFFPPSEGIISKSVFEVQLPHYIARFDIKTIEIGSRVEDAYRSIFEFLSCVPFKRYSASTAYRL